MLCRRLEELRLKNHLKKRDIAKQLNIAESTYGKWELGQRKPDLDTILQLAEFYNVSTDYILGNTDDPTPPNTEQEDIIAKAEEALRHLVESKLGREANEEELSLVDAVTDSLIKQLREKHQQH